MPNACFARHSFFSTVVMRLVAFIIISFLVTLRYSCAQSDSTKVTFDNNYPYALVAGGSKGIGYAIAEALAKRKFNLVLIARHIGPLQEAKQRLESRYKVNVEILVKDLAYDSTSHQIAQWCTERDLPLKMLCNVAGLGGAKDYLNLPLDSLRYMVNLNIESTLSLTLLLLPLLEKNSPSYVLNVASMAGFAPIPEKNMYSATKSAVIFFSYGLRYQLKEKNISVSCLAPGPVFTKPGIKKETVEKLGILGLKMAVPPKKVGEIAIKKTLRHRMIIVPGTLAKVTSTVVRVMPRRLVASIYYRLGKKGSSSANEAIAKKK
jgi:uncharacterized protein